MISLKFVDIPTEQQGLKILGCPVGHHDFVKDQLSKLADRHSVLLDRISLVDDLQSAWLLLVFCAAARANFFLRSVTPGETSAFATRHDEQTWSCFCNLLELSPASVPESSRMAATLPLRFGGLGLSSAGRLRHAAHWASWADCIGMMHQRHPTVARTIIEAIESNNPSHTTQGVVASMESLRAVGFTIPSWEELILAENQNRVPVEEEDPSKPRFGRQQEAAVAVHHTFKERELRPLLGETEEALLRTQGGPLASVPFTSLPTMRETSFDPQPFRLLLLRRLRLPLTLSARWCRCGRPLDSLGHHQSACSRAGVLGHRGHPMETVMTRICREAGARVRTNVMVRDLDLGAFNRLDGRRLEIIADGLPLWRGAQLAVDTTLVSPIKADGTARRHAARRNFIALEAARRAKERKHPELAGRGGRARLVVRSCVCQGSGCASASQVEGCCSLDAPVELNVGLRGRQLFWSSSPWS